jgi:DNA-binding HxlR family transcriptional regulator
MCSVVANFPQLRSKQWQLLRQLTSGPQAVGEIAEALGRQPGPVTKALQTLQQRGLVDVADVSEHSAPGQPRGRWSLTQEGLARAFEEAAPPRAPALPEVSGFAPESDERTSDWSLSAHQSFVSAEVGKTGIPDLLRVLEAGEQAVEASFVARFDGATQSYLFFFDPVLGARPAEALGAALDEAGFPFAVGTIADVRRMDDLIRDARSAARSASLVQRLPRDASKRRTNGGE